MVLTLSFLLLSTSSAIVEFYKLTTLDKMILLAVKLSRLDVSSTQLKQAFNFPFNYFFALGQTKQQMAYEDRCKILKWNYLERRREFLSLVECYKIVCNLNSLNFSDYFELCKSTKTRSNHQYKIQTKIAKLNCYKYSFFVKIIKFWNDLPSNVINCHDSPNINKFKLRLKNHINTY